MSNQLDDLLARELGKVGALAGKISGEAVGELGGAWGASLAAKFLPTERSEQQICAAHDVETVVTRLFAFLAAQGRIADEHEAATSQFPSIACIMGSGFFKMNPTFVYVEVLPGANGSCQVHVSAAAKEGLIKQRSAEKAVRRIADFLCTIE